jgi:hypothetical protein
MLFGAAANFGARLDAGVAEANKPAYTPSMSGMTLFWAWLLKYS